MCERTVNLTDDEKNQIINAVLKLPTGNISDAMDNLGIRRGAVMNLHRLSAAQSSAAGFALTIRQARRSTAYDGKNLARQGSVIDTETKPYDMLVIDMSGITDVCTGGALLALRAKTRGVSGELTNGCLRDADEIAALDFPVYCAGTSPVKSAKDIETIGVNVPVTIGGVQVLPGDLICMDSTGVVVVPQGRINDVIAEAEKISARESKMEEMIRAGMSIVEARKIK